MHWAFACFTGAADLVDVSYVLLRESLKATPAMPQDLLKRLQSSRDPLRFKAQATRVSRG